MARTINVHVELIDHRIGLWCNTCMTSAGAKVMIARTIHGTTMVMTKAWCTDCGGPDVEDTPLADQELDGLGSE